MRVSKSNSNSKRHIVIVGAGPGGLSTAMLLAQRGFRVQVFEKQDVIGGRNAEVRLDEYRFDLGPTFLMMKFLLDELFAEGGRRSSDYLQFRKLDPMYSLNFPGKTMLARSDPDEMKAEIEKSFPGEGASFDRFLERESIRFEETLPMLAETLRNVSQPCQSDVARGCAAHRRRAVTCTKCLPATSGQRNSASRLPFNQSTWACRRGTVPVFSP